MFNNSLSTTSVFYSAFRTIKRKKNLFFAILLFCVAVAKMVFDFFFKNFSVFQQNVGGGM
jgi:hypothetical protein